MPSAGGQADSSRRAVTAHALSDRTTPPVAPGDYFQQLLRLIQAALDPQVAAVWGVDDRGVFAKVAELTSGLPRTPPTAASARAHSKRLLDALGGDGPCVCTLGAGADDQQSDALEVLVPFTDGIRPRGVLEAVLASPSESADRDQLTAAVVEFSVYASRYVQSLRTPDGDAAEAPASSPFDRVVLELHRDLCVSQVALTAVNEGRLLLGFDRLSLAVRRGDRAKLVAVSGQEQIATRSNLVAAITDLAIAALPSAKPLRYAGDIETLPPQLRGPALEVMTAGGACCLETTPLRTPMPAGNDRDDQAEFTTCGILLGEHFEQPTSLPDRALIDRFAEHVAVALANALEMERSRTPLARLWRRFFAPSDARQARRTVITCGVALATIIAVGMAPVRHRVNAPGRLMPVNRRELFAPSEGRVQEVLVATNEQVTPGQVLLRLDNERLASELATTRHQLQEQQNLLAALEAQSGEAQSDRRGPESIRLSGAIAQARIEATSLQARVATLEGEVRELEVRAPIAGTVTTFDPRRALLNRPVARGEALLEVIDGNGPWELELDLPAKRVGHVLKASATAGQPTAVQFALATEPEQTFTGALRTVSSRIVTSPAAESVARIKVDVVASAIEHPVAGAEVVARVDCGRQPLARVLFGDVIDFVRRHVW